MDHWIFRIEYPKYPEFFHVLDIFIYPKLKSVDPKTKKAGRVSEKSDHVTDWILMNTPSKKDREPRILTRSMHNERKY